LTARLLARDQLNELHIPRRIEKMYADKMLFEIVREWLCDGVDRNAARIRSDHGRGLSMLINLGKKLVLYIKILDNGLDDKVAVADLCQIVREVAKRDQLRISERHKWRGLELFRGGKERFDDPIAHLRRFERKPFCFLSGKQLVRSDIEKKCRDTCVCKVCGDRGTHRAGPKYSSLFYKHILIFSGPNTFFIRLGFTVGVLY